MAITNMASQKPYPEVLGTRAGCEIRYTCPSCIAESIIINRSPKDHFKSSRIASCRKCRTRMTVLTPGREA